MTPHVPIWRQILPESGLVEHYITTILPAPGKWVALQGKCCRARLVPSLLGFEVRGFRWRKSVPDEITGRYLVIFLSIGCPTLWVPYNPMIVEGVIRPMEQTFRQLLVDLDERCQKSVRQYRYHRCRVFQTLVAMIDHAHCEKDTPHGHI